MCIARVLAFSAVDTRALIRKGISIFTIEGDFTNNAVIEVPYPAAYHHHSGLSSNRFMQNAMHNKTRMTFQSFGLDGHKKGDLKWRTALHQACLDAGQECVHAIPRYDGDESAEFIQAFWHNASACWYCLQPTGHSVTRKSTFECLLAGSIPVFFDQASVNHFPWSDSVNAHDLVMVLKKDAKSVHSSLAQIPVDERQKHIQNIAAVAQIYQYALDPQSELIDWHNIHRIDKWDDAFTYALKTFLRRVQAKGLLA